YDSIYHSRFITSSTSKNDKEIYHETQGGNEQKDTAIFETKEAVESNRPASLNTIIKNSFIPLDEKPWVGDEPIESTIIRMIVDKYPPPLKVKKRDIVNSNEQS